MVLFYLPAKTGMAIKETATKLRRTLRMDAFSCSDFEFGAGGNTMPSHPSNQSGLHWHFACLAKACFIGLVWALPHGLMRTKNPIDR